MTVDKVRVFEVVASRESPFWALTVPELDDVVTQARYWGEAELMARDLIAIVLDVDIETVAVNLVRSSEPDGPTASPWVHVKVWADTAWSRLTGARTS